MGQVGFPVSAADPIFQQLRKQRVRVVLVDLNSQRLEECVRAIRVTRDAVGDVAILAIGDPHNPKVLDALNAGADTYFDRNRVRDIIEFLRMYLWLINNGGDTPRNCQRQEDGQCRLEDFLLPGARFLRWLLYMHPSAEDRAPCALGKWR